MPLSKMTDLYKATAEGFSIHDPVTIYGFINMIPTKSKTLDQITENNNLGLENRKHKIKKSVINSGFLALASYGLAELVSLSTPIITEAIDKKLCNYFNLPI